MSSPNTSGKPRDGGQRQKRRSKTANGRSSETNDFCDHTDLTIEQSSQNISQEDLVSLESDLAPLLGAATAMKEEIMTTLRKWDHLVEDVTAALQGRIHVVKGASDTWGRDEEQSKKIIELEDFNQKLFRRFADIEQNCKAEKATLEQEVDKLQSEKKGLEQKFAKRYEREYHDRTKEVEEKEKQMDADHRKVKKKLEAEKAELRKTLEGEKKQEIDGMRGKIGGLEEQVKSLSDDNDRKGLELKSLNDSLKVLKRAYEHLEKEKESTVAKMEATRNEFRLPEKSDDYL